MISNFRIATTGLWTVVLGEGSLLGWVVVSVVTNYVGDQQSVSQTVWDMELGTDLVRHGVTHTQEGVRKRNTGDGGSIVNFLTGDWIVSTVGVAGR